MFSGEYTSDCAYLYETPAEEYSNLPELPVSRTGAAAVAICRDDVCLYFIGGTHDLEQNASRNVDMFDMAKGAWTKRITCLLNACMYHAAVVYSGAIIVTGGVRATDTTPSLSACQRIDASTHEVTAIQRMLDQRAHHACVVYRDEVVVIGGTQYVDVQMSELPIFVQHKNEITKCERLSADMQTWTPFPELPTPLSEISAAVACDKIFARTTHYPGDFAVFDGTAWCTMASWPVHAGLLVQLDGEIVVLPTAGGKMKKLDPVLLVWSDGPWLRSIPDHSAVVSF